MQYVDQTSEILTLCCILVTMVLLWPKFRFPNKNGNKINFSMNIASMSRWTIAAYLMLYLKNLRKNNSCNKGLNKMKFFEFLTICCISVTIVFVRPKFRFSNKKGNKKFPMSVACMSRLTIAAYLRLYLKNQRKKKNSRDKGLI